MLEICFICELVFYKNIFRQLCYDNSDAVILRVGAETDFLTH